MAKSATDSLTYENLMDRLDDEKKRLERELKKDYRRSRKYVRAHPEKGLTTAFVAGLITGIVLTKLFSGEK